MKKLTEKIHSQFISGKINSVVFSYIQKIASNTSDNDAYIFDEHINNLSLLNIKSYKDCKKYFDVVFNGSKKVEALLNRVITGAEKQELYKYALENNYENKLYFIDKLALDFIKSAYPNNMGVEGEPSIKSPYNLDKWIEAMRYIYQAADTNNLSLNETVARVTNKWNDEEKEHFKQWMKYYQEGNYNKYNVKTAQYFPQLKTPDFKPEKDMFDTSSFPKPDPNEEKKRRLDDARKKLRGRLKSIEELVEQFRDVLPQDIGAYIRKDIYDLKEKVHTLELRASIVDSIIRTSNQFNKHGFVEGAKELKKIAQEVAEDKLPEIKKEPIAPVKNVEVPELVQTTPTTAVNIPPVDATRSSIEVPNFNDISYREAIKKLEEINSVISERAVVRALAGVDIMLAQLGIASYFVELSEAQSKMMDAFNYSSSRISNIISQLRGRSLADVQTSHKAEEKKEENEERAEQKKEDSIETAEELNKPVGEIVTGPPQVLPKK